MKGKCEKRRWFNVYLHMRGFLTFLILRSIWLVQHCVRVYVNMVALKPQCLMSIDVRYHYPLCNYHSNFWLRFFPYILPFFSNFSEFLNKGNSLFMLHNNFIISYKTTSPTKYYNYYLLRY